MEFSIVDVPTNNKSNNASSLVIDAMLNNVGKAVSLPLENRDANNLRKTIRAAIANRGLLERYTYRTQVTGDMKALLVWFEMKPAQPAAEGVKA